MVTEQIMEREFYDGTIRQNHKTGWLNANDLLTLGNDYRQSIGLPKARLDRFLRTQERKAFIEQIMEEEQITKVTKTTRGNNGGTWLHPLLFTELAMYLSPKFKYIAMKWLTDKLLESRDNSGNSYREMTSAIQENYNLGGQLGLEIPKIAKKIKSKLGVDDWNKATEEQLKYRDKIHQGIILLAQAEVPLEKNITISLKSIDK